MDGLEVYVANEGVGVVMGRCSNVVFSFVTKSPAHRIILCRRLVLLKALGGCQAWIYRAVQRLLRI